MKAEPSNQYSQYKAELAKGKLYKLRRAWTIFKFAEGESKPQIAHIPENGIVMFLGMLGTDRFGFDWMQVIYKDTVVRIHDVALTQPYLGLLAIFAEEKEYDLSER